MTVELFDSRLHYAAPRGAKLTYRGGPLLTTPKLFGVFIDAFPFVEQMRTYLDWYPTSDLITQLQEYNIPGPCIHKGDASLSLSSNVPPPTPPPPPPHKPRHCAKGCVPATPSGIHHLQALVRHKKVFASNGTLVTDTQLQQFIGRSITNGLLPTPDSQTLYVLFLPPGLTVQLGGDQSCVTFCGYHNYYAASGGNIYYAVLPFPTCAGCLGGLSPFDALTAIASHEISEAITDPVPGGGWYDDQNGENGDICAWQQRADSGFTVQLEWSDASTKCI